MSCFVPPRLEFVAGAGKGRRTLSREVASSQAIIQRPAWPVICAPCGKSCKGGGDPESACSAGGLAGETSTGRSLLLGCNACHRGTVNRAQRPRGSGPVLGAGRRTFRAKGQACEKVQRTRIWGSRRFMLGQKAEEAGASHTNPSGSGGCLQCPLDSSHRQWVL